MYLHQDLTGQHINLLTVRCRSPGEGPESWICDCRCGSSRVYTTARLLKNGGPYSCGCYQRVCQAAEREFRANNEVIMAQLWPFEYRQWKRLKGKRRLCRQWSRSFETFMEDMGAATSDCIDRPDRGRRFAPGNAFWGRNPKKKPVLVKWEGELVPLKEWSRSEQIRRDFIRRQFPGETELDGREIVRQHAKWIQQRAARRRQAARRRADANQRASEAHRYDAPFTPSMLRA